MSSSSSSTSVAESGAVGEIRSPCSAAALQTAVEVEVVDVDENVVIRASSVGSGILQANAAAEQKPVPECLLKSTEAISSSRLYSNTQTHREVEKEMGTFERRQREKKSLSAQNT